MTKSQGSPFFVVIRCTLPCAQSDQPVVEGGKDRTICLCTDRVIGAGLGIRIQREIPSEHRRETVRVSPLSSRYPNPSVWIRSQHPCQAEPATQETTSRTWKSRMRTSFRGLPRHSAQIFPSMSSINPSHHAQAADDSVRGDGGNRPFLNRYRPSSTPTHRLPARSSSNRETWSPGRPLPARMDETLPFTM